MPNNSTTISLPIKRQLDLGHLSLAEKQCIINSYEEMPSNEPASTIIDVVSNISHTMGIAHSTVYRILKEYKRTGTVSSSRHSGGRPSLVATFDESVKCAVQKIVERFFERNETPTLDKITKELKCRPDLPQMSRSSLYKFLDKINYKYRNLKSGLYESSDADFHNGVGQDDDRVESSSGNIEDDDRENIVIIIDNVSPLTGNEEVYRNFRVTRRISPDSNDDPLQGSTKNNRKGRKRTLKAVNPATRALGMSAPVKKVRTSDGNKISRFVERLVTELRDLPSALVEEFMDETRTTLRQIRRKHEIVNSTT